MNFLNNNDFQYYNFVKTWMIDFISPGKHNILDLGCANGRLGVELIERGLVNNLTGIELSKQAAEEASKYYTTVIQGDIEHLDLLYEGYFDYVICADILEHLRDPWSVIERIKFWLKPGGYLLIVVPNIRNYRIISSLAFNGCWKYANAGILDITHLRFFTKKTIIQNLVDANFKIINAKLIVEGKKKSIINILTFEVFDEFFGSQIFVKARI